MITQTHMDGVYRLEDLRTVWPETEDTEIRRFAETLVQAEPQRITRLRDDVWEFRRITLNTLEAPQ